MRAHEGDQFITAFEKEAGLHQLIKSPGCGHGVISARWTWNQEQGEPSSNRYGWNGAGDRT